MLISILRILSISLALWLVTGTGVSANEPEDRSVILMFGDSITYGTGVLNDMRPGIGNGDNRGPSVEELQRLLIESRRPAIVLNWGWGGTPSGGGGSIDHQENGLGRIAASIDASISAHTGKQYFILIQYGTNDEGYGISTATTGANNEAMVYLARSKGVIPLLANLPPRSDEDVIPRNNAIKSVALNNNVPFVDHHSTFTSFSTYFVLEPKFLEPDVMIYLHPNKMGYDKIASNWFQSELMTLIEPEPDPATKIAPIIMLLLDED